MLVEGDEARIDVGASSNSGRVTEVLGHLLDCLDDAFPPRADAVSRTTRQRDRCMYRAVPGSKVLGGDIDAEQILEVVVYLRGVQGLPPASDLIGEQRAPARRASPAQSDPCRRSFARAATAGRRPERDRGSRRPAARARQGDRGIACAPANRTRPPAGDRSVPGRSTPVPTQAGSPVPGSVGRPWRQEACPARPDS
jgi:hypothetical protein